MCEEEGNMEEKMIRIDWEEINVKEDRTCREEVQVSDAFTVIGLTRRHPIWEDLVLARQPQ